MPTAARRTGNSEVDMATGRKLRGKQSQQQQRQQAGEHGVGKSAASFASDVARELDRELSGAEREKIMAAVHEGKIKLSVGDEDWQKAVRLCAEDFHQRGALGSSEPGEPKEPVTRAAIVLQSQELKLLVKADARFLEKLKEFEAMPDVALGDKERPLTKKMSDHYAAAQAELEKERLAFLDNRPMFYELKQRLLNPKYRPDLAGGGAGRTVEDNLKNYGAADWQDFRKKYIAYSLSQTDKLLRAWEKETKLLGEGVVGGNALTAATEASAATTGGSATAKSGGKELDAKDGTTTLKAEIGDRPVGLLSNPPKGASAEQIVETMQAAAQHAVEGMSPEQQLKCEPSKFVTPNTVEELAIQLARLIFQRFDPDAQRDFTKKQRKELDALAIAILRAAGITKVGKMEVPAAKPETAGAEPKGEQRKKAASAVARKQTAAVRKPAA